MLPFYFANYGENEQAFAALAFQHPAHAAAKRYFDAREFLTKAREVADGIACERGFTHRIEAEASRRIVAGSEKIAG